LHKSATRGKKKKRIRGARARWESKMGILRSLGGREKWKGKLCDKTQVLPDA